MRVSFSHYQITFYIFMLMRHNDHHNVNHRNSDRLGNGVLYASVNPEYFSAAESKTAEYLPKFTPVLGCVWC